MLVILAPKSWMLSIIILTLQTDRAFYFILLFQLSTHFRQAGMLGLMLSTFIRFLWLTVIQIFRELVELFIPKKSKRCFNDFVFILHNKMNLTWICYMCSNVHVIPSANQIFHFTFTALIQLCLKKGIKKGCYKPF